jgi:hypothetical protein
VLRAVTACRAEVAVRQNPVCGIIPAGTMQPQRKQIMSQENPLSDYLILSRGQWDKDASREDIQDAIDRFYAWYDRLLGEGSIGQGQRLTREGKVVSRQATKDGPFAEAKEVVGGYWFIRANSLNEAARIAAENPCLAYGLVCEVRPIDPVRGSAYALTNETPT